MRRVVVTGLGMVSPVGLDVKSSWKETLAGRSGVRRITAFNADPFPVQIAAELKGFEPAKYFETKEVSRITKFCQYAVAASEEAVLDAKLHYKDSDTRRWGTVIGVGLGGLEDIELRSLELNKDGYRKVSPFFLPYTIPNMAAGLVSTRFNLKGPNMCTTTACASGTHAVGESLFYIQHGIADVMVCGGAENAISPLGIVAFANMKALSKDNEHPETASKPFDLERSGFVMGEGAGVLVLEELSHAKARGAHIYAEVIGYGLSGDAHHITAPAPEGEGGQRCMAMAMEYAGVKPHDLQYINAHGTSTKMNDAFESAAIEKVFGEHAKKLAVSSTKGVTGHCLGAAGGIEAVFTVKTIEEQIVPPTASLKTPDPECRLDYVAEGARRMNVQVAMSNSFGFGGTNASVIFSRFVE